MNSIEFRIYVDGKWQPILYALIQMPAFSQTFDKIGVFFLDLGGLGRARPEGEVTYGRGITHIPC